jgi:hypothetical protein
MAMMVYSLESTYGGDVQPSLDKEVSDAWSMIYLPVHSPRQKLAVLAAAKTASATGNTNDVNTGKVPCSCPDTSDKKFKEAWIAKVESKHSLKGVAKPEHVPWDRTAVVAHMILGFSTTYSAVVTLSAQIVRL